MSTSNEKEAAKHEFQTIRAKTLYEAYILWIPPFGLLGAHHFYLRRYSMGLLYLLTVGLFGVGFIVDAFRMPMLVKQANSDKLHPRNLKKASVIDVYLLWTPPLGLLGAHHFYLRRYGWGVAYLCTVGFFGLGFLADLFYIPLLVKEFNAELHADANSPAYQPKANQRKLASAYIMALPPVGFFGSHQLYLGNYFMFPIYVCTFGLFGVGWLADFFRMPVLLRRWQERQAAPALYRKVYADDAYLLLLPLGLFGLHHFYLRRTMFGMIYFFTLGLFGLGVLVDFFLIPLYVRRSNADEEAKVNARLASAPGVCFTNSVSSASIPASPSQSGEKPSMAPGTETDSYPIDKVMASAEAWSSCSELPFVERPLPPPAYYEAPPPYHYVTVTVHSAQHHVTRY